MSVFKWCHRDGRHPPEDIHTQREHINPFKIRLIQISLNDVHFLSVVPGTGNTEGEDTSASVPMTCRQDNHTQKLVESEANVRNWSTFDYDAWKTTACTVGSWLQITPFIDTPKGNTASWNETSRIPRSLTCQWNSTST